MSSTDTQGKDWHDRAWDAGQRYRGRLGVLEKEALPLRQDGSGPDLLRRDHLRTPVPESKPGILSRLRKP